MHLLPARDCVHIELAILHALSAVAGVAAAASGLAKCRAVLTAAGCWHCSVCSKDVPGMLHTSCKNALHRALHHSWRQCIGAIGPACRAVKPAHDWPGLRADSSERCCLDACSLWLCPAPCSEKLRAPRADSGPAACPESESARTLCQRLHFGRVYVSACMRACVCVRACVRACACASNSSQAQRSEETQWLCTVLQALNTAGRQTMNTDVQHSCPARQVQAPLICHTYVPGQPSSLQRLHLWSSAFPLPKSVCPALVGSTRPR